MHVHHSPRSKYRFLVWVAECVEDGRDTLYSFLNGELIGSTGHLTDAFTCLAEDIWVVILLELLELFLINALGHEFFPRSVINEARKIVNRNLLILILQLCSIDKQRHTNGNASKDANGIFTLIAHGFQFIQSSLFLRCQFLLGFLLKSFLFFVLLFGKSLVVDVNVTRLCHSLCSANGFLQIIKVLQLYIRQL